MKLIHGNCLDVLRSMPDNSVDAVVTDPPYGLGEPPDPAVVLRSWLDDGTHTVKGGGFMGKEWDSFVPPPEVWRECFRVLKPGGHLSAFFGTRTYDWGAMAIRLAGFEIRTSLSWNFATGFPKGNDIGRAIDLSRGGVGEWNVSEDEIDWLGTPNEHIQQHRASVKDRGTSNPVIYTPSDPEAAPWKGWNTQLKPAHEPICLARKPCSEPTVAKNVLRWGTGALNIGACRIPGADSSWERTASGTYEDQFWQGKKDIDRIGGNQGRYPATVLHDGSDAVVREFPHGKSGQPLNRMHTDPGSHVGPNKHGSWFATGYGDEGSASRYFAACPFEDGELESLVPFLYCAKASPSERNAGLTKRSNHPTVKPIRLMEWLCNLLCPPGGLILDPFMGSGTTGIAAGRNGFDFIGCELQSDYHALATERIAHWTHYRPELPKVSNPIPLGTTNTPTLF